VTSKSNRVALEKALAERKGKMNRKAYGSVLALIFLALAFLPGCSSTPQTPAPAQVITVSTVSGYNQTAATGAPYAAPFVAIVTTNGVPGEPNGPGTPVVGAVVTFTSPMTPNEAGGTFANGNNYTTATTDSTGTAMSTTFTANNNAGIYNVIASAEATTSTATFVVQNTGAAAGGIVPASGDAQEATLGTRFATGLSATVVDEEGRPLSGAIVTFTAPEPAGTFADSGTHTTTAITDAIGVATAAAFKASAVAGGPYTVKATVAGVAKAAEFSLKNVPEPQ
jgi:hypothetical protein